MNHYHVFDLIDREVVFEGTQDQCLAWLKGQRDYHNYDLRERTNEETVPAEYWSGGIASNH